MTKPQNTMACIDPERLKVGRLYAIAPKSGTEWMHCRRALIPCKTLKLFFYRDVKHKAYLI